MKKVFLGGTCNGSMWREEMIPLLKIDHFNPVVEDWTEESQEEEELRQREECDYCLYVITPEMKGVYSIAEAVDDSHRCPEKTIFCFGDYGGEEFDEHQMKSLAKVGEMIERNGGRCFTTLKDAARYMNDEESELIFKRK